MYKKCIAVSTAIITAFTASLFPLVVCSEDATEPTTENSDSDDIQLFLDACEALVTAEGEAARFIATAGGGYTAGALYGIYICTKDPMHSGLGDIDASSIRFASGYYTYNNKLCTAYSANVSGSGSFADKRIPVVESTKFDVTFVGGSDVNSITGFYEESLNSSTGVVNIVRSGFSSNTLSGSRQSQLVFQSHDDAFSGESGTYSCPTRSTGYAAFYNPMFRASVASDIPELSSVSVSVICQSLSYSGGKRIFALSASGTLPSGTINLANPTDYINNTLRPYILENYPDYIDLLPPDPDAPQPTNPPFTLPPDWLVQPDLPTSPTIDFEIPTADLSPLDPSEAVERVRSSSGFWWTLTGDIMDTLSIKWVYVVALALAILAYILWQLGR